MKEKCHFIGIGGIGMSGLARLLLSRNIQVTGSDLNSNYVTEGLAKAGAEVFIGHDSRYITPDLTVVYSTDIKKDNAEYQAALNLKCPMLHRSDLLIKLMSGNQVIAVTGTHGKTTTSSLLSWILSECGLDPSFAVGGFIPQFQSNAGHGNGPYFVAEADESDGTFLKYNPFAAIVTNIDFDHMNYFGNEVNLVNAFKKFMQQVTSSEHLFFCGDDFRLTNLAMSGVSYGFSFDCDLKASGFIQKDWSVQFDVDFQGVNYPKVEVSLVGQHNALNALAVFGLAIKLGVTEERLRAALKSFGGVARRCEKKGSVRGILFLDDYAHHPTEVKATLKGIKEAVNERRLVAVFQPHRYTRTRDCLGAFGNLFEDADEIITTDIFAAGEAPIAGVTSAAVHEEISSGTKIPCRYIPRDDLNNYLSSFLRPHDVVVTLGAGDITRLGGELVAKFQHNPPYKLRVGVVFGGRSFEHEISLISAQHICNSLNRDHYELQYFGITKQGKWICGENLKNAMFDSEIKADLNMLPNLKNALSSEVMDELYKCDIFFCVLHGAYGEDGTMQGFFEILDKPYVGCDHRSAAVCMDKALTKRLMLMKEIPTAPFVGVTQYEWSKRPSELQEEIESQLNYPLFVKPVHLGSTVGVKKVGTREELVEAIAYAFCFDNQIIVEKGLEIREIEFAVLGNDRVMTFPPGEICSGGKLYDYEAKYGPQGMSVDPKANLPMDKIEEGMALAKAAYQAAGCQGLARVDCFLDGEGKFWLNEINPFPGFTKSSLYPLICETNGLDAQELMHQLIILGLHRKRQQRSYAEIT